MCEKERHRRHRQYDESVRDANSNEDSRAMMAEIRAARRAINSRRVRKNKRKQASKSAD